MAELKGVQSRAILTEINRMFSAFTHTLNPYSGCSFGCRYCYVRDIPFAKFRNEEWGTWVDVKTNAIPLLVSDIRKAKRKGPVKIFMSSATDPYQPIEARLELTRRLLEVMLKEEIDHLHVHTRSPLVKRDIDLLKEFGDKVIVNVTIETDLENIRKFFAPSAPPIPARINALKAVTEAGIPTCVAIMPMLPCSPDMGRKLREATAKVSLDTFTMGGGSRVGRSTKMGIPKMFKELDLLPWYGPNAHKAVVDMLKNHFEEVVLLHPEE